MTMLVPDSLASAPHVAYELGAVCLRGLILYAFYLPVIAIHETGHWVVGRRFGFQGKEFRISCVRWIPNGGWRFQPSTIWLVTGHVRMQPTLDDPWMRFRFLTFVLAGPAANLASAAVLLPLARSATALGSLAKIFIIFSLVIGLANLVPFATGKLKSDGLQALLILFSRRRAENMRFVIRFNNQLEEFRRLIHSENWSTLRCLAADMLVLPHSGNDVKPIAELLSSIVEDTSKKLSAEGLNLKPPSLNKI